MKHYLFAALILILALMTTACAADTEDAEPETEAGTAAAAGEEAMKTDQMEIRIGEHAVTAVLEDNESAEALKELLADGTLTVSASNYGGFEKVCSLGTSLPRRDSRMTARPGDICLYSGDQIVIFYGSNTWEYTKLGRVSDAQISQLEEILSGEEGEAAFSLKTR